MTKQKNDSAGGSDGGAYKRVRELSTQISACESNADPQGWIKKQTNPPKPDDASTEGWIKKQTNPPAPYDSSTYGWLKKQTNPPTPSDDSI